MGRNSVSRSATRRCRAVWFSLRWPRSRKSKSVKLGDVKSIRTVVSATLCVACIGAAVAGCGSNVSDPQQAQQPQHLQINGAGATFPFPIYSKWFDEYHKVHGEV